VGDIDYQNQQFAHAPMPSLDQSIHDVVVVGAGPVGLSMALDMAQRGHRVVLLDDDCRLSTGSRAICFAKRTLDIWDRMGVGNAMVKKGISWNVGKIFFKDDPVWTFDLLPESGHRRPAFINLQQYYCEGYLCDAASKHANIDLRWKHKAIALTPNDQHVVVTVETPGGSYTLSANWLIACDGARSALRKILGLESQGRIFRDRFLIADIKMKADFPAERWFWFDPPFHPNQSVLLHSQPDNVWRIDFQLGWDADPAEETKPENVVPRIRALLGQDVQFDLQWVSIYTFACERMHTFRHDRVLFAGDAAHRVSPFGARGANSGVQDVDNLAWKLDLVIRGLAPTSLIDTYCHEREFAADENIRHSSRSTDFITPKSEISLLFRNMTLRLAKNHDFARKLVNSGRLSTASSYTQSLLNTPDSDAFEQALSVGATAPDAPIIARGVKQWWLGQLGDGFVLAVFCPEHLPASHALNEVARLQEHPPGLRVVLILNPALDPSPIDAHGLAWVYDSERIAQARYDARQHTCYLLRPDQHIAARWRSIDTRAVAAALQRATHPTETIE
jgi:3-(3-hydroxy-phenyl)propionate hydroxylase